MRRDFEGTDLKEILDTPIPGKITAGILGILGGALLFSSVYLTGPTEEGVVTRLGKYNRSNGPGIHMKYPWPVESIENVSITEVKRLEVGFRTLNPGAVPAKYEKHPEISIMLTGDENIVQSEFIVQYRIKNAAQYLFNIENPEETLRDAAEAAHRQVIGDHGIDGVLTNGKIEIQNKTRDILQQIMDSYNTGILVAAIQLQDVYPPVEVVPSFKDVATARENMSMLINKAKEYENDILPKTRGEAEQKIKGAEAYRAERINKAKGDAARFTEILTQYEKAPQITEDRLYIETMKKIYPKLD